MSGVAGTTNSQTSAVDGSTTNSGPIKASAFYGSGAGLTGLPSSGGARETHSGANGGVALNGATPRYIGFVGIATADSGSGWSSYCGLINACTITNLHIALTTGTTAAGTNVTVTLYTNAPGNSPVATAITATINAITFTADSGTLAAVIRDNNTVAHFEAISNMGAGTNVSKAVSWTFEKIAY